MIYLQTKISIWVSLELKIQASRKIPCLPLSLQVSQSKPIQHASFGVGKPACRCKWISHLNSRIFWKRSASHHHGPGSIPIQCMLDVVMESRAGDCCIDVGDAFAEEFLNVSQLKTWIAIIDVCVMTETLVRAFQEL